MTAPGPADARTNAELVALVLEGRQDLFGTIAERYQGLLYRYALGMVSRPDVAADLAQEALVKAYTRLESCRDPERFGSWLFRILRNQCLDHLKSRRQRNVSIDEITVYAPARDDPQVRLERSELGRSMNDALQTLPEQQREAFLMKHVEGLAYDEMALLLDTSVSALKMRVKRAREALQQVLRPSAEMNEPV